MELQQASSTNSVSISWLFSTFSKTFGKIHNAETTTSKKGDFKEGRDNHYNFIASSKETQTSDGRLLNFALLSIERDCVKQIDIMDKFAIIYRRLDLKYKSVAYRVKCLEKKSQQNYDICFCLFFNLLLVLLNNNSSI